MATRRRGGLIGRSNVGKSSSAQENTRKHNIIPTNIDEANAGDSDDQTLLTSGKNNANPDTSTVPSFERSEPKSLNSVGPQSDHVSDEKADHLAEVNISSRRGNYLLTVGLPRSGKTVLQSFMTYYMGVAGKLDAQLDNKEKGKAGTINHEAQRIQTLWLDSWKKGEFPESTSVGENEIRELRLTVTNNENSGQKFNLSFLEISGENFLSVVPDRNQIPKLFDRLKSFLTNKNIKINIIFLLKSDEENEQVSCDALFTNFIQFANNELNIDVRKKLNLILVLPDTKSIFGEDKWAQAKKNKRLYEKIMKSYVYEKFPATYMIYNNWKKNNRAIMAFNIGDIENEKLKNQNFEDVKSFINLNYRLFTGKNLSPRFKWFKKLLGSQ